MIGVIPNPKRSFEIERSKKEVNLAIEHLPFFSTQYKLYKFDSILNVFTIDVTEFLSVGVYIDVSTETINENTTRVTIEVRRKIGSFDQSHEISLANRHMVAVAELISKSIQTDVNIRLGWVEKKRNEEKKAIELMNQRQIKKDEEKKNNPVRFYVKKFAVAIVVILIIASVIYLVNNESKTTVVAGQTSATPRFSTRIDSSFKPGTSKIARVDRIFYEDATEGRYVALTQSLLDKKYALAFKDNFETCVTTFSKKELADFINKIKNISTQTESIETVSFGSRGTASSTTEGVRLTSTSKDGINLVAELPNQEIDSMKACMNRYVSGK
jgi:hypothetical protein